MADCIFDGFAERSSVVTITMYDRAEKQNDPLGSVIVADGEKAVACQRKLGGGAKACAFELLGVGDEGSSAFESEFVVKMRLVAKQDVPSTVG